MSSDERPRTLSGASLPALEAWLAETLPAGRVTIKQTELLSGGAVQENWRIEVHVSDGDLAGTNTWVLRTDAAAVISVSLDRATEFAVLTAAHRARVKVAAPIVRCPDREVIGAPFLIQRFVAGTAQARRIARHPKLAQWGTSLAEDIARELATIHHMSPATTDLPALPLPITAPAKHEVGKLRRALDETSEPRPALEYVLYWLDQHAPTATGDLVLVHGDYRTGNYLVDGLDSEHPRLTAVLDWEFAHWGDPDEDLGWFCAACWRFGNFEREAGGLAPRAVFLDAYTAASGRTPEPQRLRYWEIMAAAKWATIAHQQGDRFRTGGEKSVELALTGLMVSELELEALDGITAWTTGRD